MTSHKCVFESKLLERGDLLKSMPFTLENSFHPCEFQISIIRLPNNAYNDHRISAKIEVRKSNKERAKANVTISGPQLGTLFKTQTSWIDTCIFNISLVLSNEPVTFTCAINEYGPFEPLCEYPSTNLDIGAFLLQPSLSDCKILVDGQELPVHTIILSAHSRVFFDIFNSHADGKKRDTLTISGVSIDVVKNVLTYMYTGSTEALNEDGMVSKVLAIAHDYGIEKLKIFCACKLYENLTILNAFETFSLADDYKIDDLKQKCLEFIIKNRKAIVDLPNFHNLCIDKPQLTYIILENIIKNC